MSHSTPSWRRHLSCLKYDNKIDLKGKEQPRSHALEQAVTEDDCEGEALRKLEATAINFLADYKNRMPLPRGEKVPAIRILASRIPACQMDRKQRRELARYIAKEQVKKFKKEGFFDRARREAKKLADRVHAAGLVLPGDRPPGQAPAVERRSPGGLILP